MSNTIKSAPSIQGLHIVGYANGFKYWHYKPTPDETMKDIFCEGHFSAFADLLAEGDEMTISSTRFGMRGFIFGAGPNIRFVLPHHGVAIP